VPNQNAPDEIFVSATPKALKICSAILRQPKYELRRFISTTASIGSLDAPFCPGRWRGQEL